MFDNDGVSMLCLALLVLALAYGASVLFDDDLAEATAFTNAASVLDQRCASASCAAYAGKPGELMRQVVMGGAIDRNDAWYPRLTATYDGATGAHRAVLADARATLATCEDVIRLGGKHLAFGTLAINGVVYDYDKPRPSPCDAHRNTLTFSVAAR